jgi:hypothetical protein
MSIAIWYERILARKIRMLTCNAISGGWKCNSPFLGDHGWVGIEITPLILPSYILLTKVVITVTFTMVVKQKYTYTTLMLGLVMASIVKSSKY